MIVTTPNPRYRFLTREGSSSDELVIGETWCENVYQIFPGDFADTGVLIDIGANIGAVAIYAASFNDRCPSPPVTVIAVEPEPDNVTYLAKNIADNNVAGLVRIHQVAVSQERGVGYIVEGHGHSVLAFTPQPNSAEIAVLRLADIFTDNAIPCCDVCKIDVEGAEAAIIAGANVETLQRIRYLTMEFDAAPDDVFGLMVAKLAKVFNVHIVGSPERGGYIYARRYECA